ncbi:MAG: MBL fold metallo-hydrolase [Muribaculaceae bacterium]|nr:MBL fold metallo-hydrolase [Muribaculaceae bacterium]
MVSVTYIWHDCFVISTDEITMVFDFWKDPEAESRKFPRFIEEASSEKPIYIFVSHHHKDHFVKEIFEWERKFENITYILSKDVARSVRHILNHQSLYKGIKPEPERVIVMGEGDSHADRFLEIKAYGSTDIGNSYFISTCGLNIFHAGDLNAWLWIDESTPTEIEEAMGHYREIIQKIKGEVSFFDIAMFPVDSRIGTEYYAGAKIFVEEFDVRRFFPMHFGLGTLEEQSKYASDAARFELYANRGRGEYIALLSPYSKYAFSD